MAQNDAYIPGYSNVASSGTVSFDGSASNTNTAIINEIEGDSNATIRIQEFDSGTSSWVTTTQLEDDAGNLTFNGPWHSQFNRILVESGTRRVQITNESGSAGNFAVTGDEK